MSDLHNAVVKDEILYFLEKAWRKNPNLRLMQLLGNGLPAEDNYYVADQTILDYLVKVANEVED